MKEISIVIPVYNEEKNIPVLIEAVRAAMDKYGKSYACIFIDDGSSDKTFEVIKGLKKAYPFLKGIKLKMNFGQTHAIVAGFDIAEGDVIITMDGDLQNDPDDIPRLLAKLDEGYDIVSGWRDKRKDPFLMRKLPSSMANWIISQMTGIKLHDFGCTLKAYKKGVVKNIKLYGEMHRFIPAIASYMGTRVAEIRVKHHNRRYGVSKYGISRITKVLLDLIAVKLFLSYSRNPMRLFGAVALGCFFLGFLCAISTTIAKLTGQLPVTGNPVFFLMILMGIIGVQCILMGMLGEMNVRIYHEFSNRPIYVIDEAI